MHIVIYISELCLSPANFPDAKRRKSSATRRQCNIRYRVVRSNFLSGIHIFQSCIVYMHGIVSLPVGNLLTLAGRHSLVIYQSALACKNVNLLQSILYNHALTAPNGPPKAKFFENQRKWQRDEITFTAVLVNFYTC